MSQCPRCQSSVTPLMNVCVNCGFPLKQKAVPHFNTNNNSYIPQTDYVVEKPFHPNHQSVQPYTYEKQHKANLLVMIIFIILLGLLSAFGYYLIATNHDSAGRNILGVILIIISVIINLVFLFG